MKCVGHQAGLVVARCVRGASAQRTPEVVRAARPLKARSRPANRTQLLPGSQMLTLSRASTPEPATHVRPRRSVKHRCRNAAARRRRSPPADLRLRQSTNGPKV